MHNRQHRGLQAGHCSHHRPLIQALRTKIATEVDALPEVEELPQHRTIVSTYRGTDFQLKVASTPDEIDVRVNCYIREAGVRFESQS